jgi:hypothetical protein
VPVEDVKQRTTSPGLEPGPSTDGMSPSGQGERKWHAFRFTSNGLSLDFRDLRQQIPQFIAILLADPGNTVDLPL